MRARRAAGGVAPPADEAEDADKVPGKVEPAPKKGARTPKKREAPPRIWIEPDGDLCPSSHPVKAKLASRIFHMPGAFAYDRTRPDRCYRDEGTAAADGFKKAKR
ncbi:MAG TPA: hypothetical protein VMY34_04550 [Acidimicrobiales bacterium]|nr:hypothetical protein [Acidimicrobiales bacterium]